MFSNLLTPKGVADVLGMDYREVLKRFKASGFATQIGRNWYLPWERIDEYLEWEYTLSHPPTPTV